MNAEADPRTSAARCPCCLGHGTVNDAACSACRGSGYARPNGPQVPAPPVPELTDDELRLMAEAASLGSAAIPGRLRCTGCSGTGRGGGGSRMCNWCTGRGWCDPAAVTGEP